MFVIIFRLRWAKFIHYQICRLYNEPNFSNVIYAFFFFKLIILTWKINNLLKGRDIESAMFYESPAINI